MNNKQRISALLISALMLAQPAACFAEAAPVSATYSAGIVEIGSVEDLKNFSDSCRLDSFSMGKTFVLTCDLNVAGTGFKPIPSFSGTFDGNGHKISGLNLTGNGSAMGLFRYVEKNGTVKNLTVEGLVSPSGSACKVGAVAGVNRGKIMYCTVNILVSGKEQCGGICGVNEETGMIGKCVSNGRVQANHYAGGIAGENLGGIRSCENNADINTNVTESTIELSDISVSDIYSTEKVADITDEGGIAGCSSGTIQNCINRGSVGYPHVGYNVGGIVGRQSGYVSGCENYGEIFGRKDTGGIVGQAEPHLMISYSEEKLDELNDALSELNRLIDRTIDNADANGDRVSGSFDDINDTLGDMRDKSDLMLDEAERIINTDVDSLNELVTRLSDGIEMLKPVTDAVSDSADLVADAFGEISSAGVLLSDTANNLGDGMEQIFDSTEELSAAITDLQSASTAISDSLTALEEGLGDPEQMEKAIDALCDDIHIAKFAVKSIASNSSALISAVERYKNASDVNAATDRIEKALNSISKTSDTMADDLDRLSSALELINDSLRPVLDKAENGEYFPEREETEEIPDTAESAETEEPAESGEPESPLGILGGFDPEDIPEYDGGDLSGWTELAEDIANALSEEDLRELAESAEAVVGDVSDLFEGFSELSGGISDLVNGESLKTLSSSLDRIFEDIKDDMNYISVYTDDSVAEPDLDIDKLKEAVNYVKTAMDSMTSSGNHAKDAISVIEGAWEYLDRASVAAAAAATCVSDAADIAERASDRLSDAADEAGYIVDYFSGKPEVSFVGADDGFIESRDNLFDTLSALTDDLDRLNGFADNTGDVLAADLRAINDQCEEIKDILYDMVKELEDTSLDPEDYTEDISSEDKQGFAEGKIALSRNYGRINADVNVGGIVGAMGAENALDPESDTAETIGEHSLNFMYLLRAVVRSCDNYGEVIAKKDGAGGVVGEMSVGSVIGCGGFGDVSSTNGGYVGGVVGASSSSIIDSYSMCRLSGGDYVGGIAGKCKDMSGCRAFSELTEWDEFAGAVAGCAEGELSGNIFVENSFGAVDGISYRSKAFPVTYEKMLTLSGIPEEFSVMKLIFMADDVPVAVLEYGYGDSIPDSDIPAVPEKEGCYAKWESFEREELHYGAIINAEYYNLISAVASEATREDGLPVFLAEGAYSDSASLFAEESGGVWTVSIPDDGSQSHVVRYYCEGEPKKTDVCINGAVVSSEADGRYLVFTTELSEFELTESKKPLDPKPFIIGGAGAAAVAAIIVAAAVHKKKKAAKEESEVKQ